MKCFFWISAWVVFFCYLPSLNAQCYYYRVDRLGNTWIIQENKVVCFDKALKLKGDYSNIQLGNPTTIDVSNPFKVLIFYSLSQTMVFLNNTVSQIGEPIILPGNKVGEAALVCTSSNGGIWVFDRQGWEIKLFDQAISFTSFKVVPEEELSNHKPVFLQEISGMLFVGFINKGLYMYDGYGNIQNIFHIDLPDQFFITDSSVLFCQNQQVLEYKLFGNGNSPSFQRKCVNSCLPLIINNKEFQYNGSKILPCEK